MTGEIPAPRLEALSALVAERLGLHLPAAKLRTMERALAEAARAAGFARAADLVAALLRGGSAPEALDALARELTVGETYFYREPGAFAAITEHFLPEFTRRGWARMPRFWSAGCCTGEEAYSLAIVLERAGFPAPARAEILATDLNPRFLRSAREGIYRGWSFRNTPDWLRSAYFRPFDEERAEIRGDIRAAVRFARLNLAEPVFPAADNGTANVDLILCRNVLMYFTPERLARVIRQMADCLNEGGWLIVGAAETGHVEALGLSPLRWGDVTIFEKRTSRAARAPVASESSGWTGASVAPRPAPLPVAVSPAAERARPPEAAAPSLGEVRRLASAGNRPEALAACERLLRIDPTDAIAHFLRSSVLLEAGRREQAEESLRRALYLDPDFVAAHLAVAQAARTAGRSAAAERHLGAALRLVSALPAAAIVPETDGMTAGQMAAMISALGSGGPGTNRRRPAVLANA